MSKNYDNWERLVRAVLRRENDRRIALLHSSTDSSSNSTSSSFDPSFGPANFQIHDHDQSQERSRLVMNYTDLGLDHSQWKKMLPPELFCGQKNSKEPTSGTSSRDGVEFVSHHPDSRFSEVVELTDSIGVEIHCRIKAQVFSPDTLYAAYLVFDSILEQRFFLDKNGKNCFLFGAYSRPGISPQPGYKFTGYPDFSYKDERAPQKALSFVGIDEGVWDYGYSKELARIVEFGRSKERPDRWREIEIEKFYTGLEEDRYLGEVSDVLVQLLGSTGYVIEGIEFRPLDEDEERVENLPEELFSDLRISENI